MHVFALPFPMFDPADGLHLRLAALSERAEEVAGSVELDDRLQFQKARRVIREALREDGVADDIAVRHQAASVAIAQQHCHPATLTKPSDAGRRGDPTPGAR